ncbi:hypothetical protein [Microbacterium phyllosphaerae]|uniref:hypothetical protein n=1 Tax=Microbacterium phyllosphaerae TaxID=124798 RepID=UPI00216765CC|nr:hypothetical protein [Microbacterium phyllosphaerae]MCS3442557.1 hypothetical protein [Microbacterium phyllosphaerae]
MTGALEKRGLHARWKGADYRLERKGSGWVLQTDRATAGFEKAAFTKHAPERFERKIDPTEKLECFRISHAGVYRRIAVELSPSNQGRVMAVTKDPRARENGFDSFERDAWVKLIPADDRDLRITETRTPVPAPWLTAPGGRP